MSNTKIISGIVVAVIAIGGISTFAVMNSNKPAVVDKVMSKTSEVMVNKNDAMMAKNLPAKNIAQPAEMDKMTADEKMAMEKMTPDQKESMMMKKDEVMEKKAGEVMVKTGYIAYSAEAIAANADGTNIIFFHAPWCPTCKAAEVDINTNLSTIPAKFNILKTDFDTSTALKQKYGVTSQSTFVKVDKDGNKLSMGNGFTKLADIVAFGSK